MPQIRWTYPDLLALRILDVDICKNHSELKQSWVS